MNLVSSFMLYNNSYKAYEDKEDINLSISRLDYIMSLNDWTNHEEEYENYIVDYLNCHYLSKDCINEIIKKVQEYDIDFTPGICERCMTVFNEGYICNNKPYCCENCITETISENRWISMQEYEPDENKRKIFWG